MGSIFNTIFHEGPIYSKSSFGTGMRPNINIIWLHQPHITYQDACGHFY